MNTIINIITWLSFGFYILGFLFLFVTLMSTFQRDKRFSSGFKVTPDGGFFSSLVISIIFLAIGYFIGIISCPYSLNECSTHDFVKDVINEFLSDNNSV